MVGSLMPNRECYLKIYRGDSGNEKFIMREKKEIRLNASRGCASALNSEEECVHRYEAVFMCFCGFHKVYSSVNNIIE